jgi:predicted RNA binding protein YcfA (HicA-like mRNA interferase family)
MPKLPHISGTEAVRALQELGFEVIRQKGKPHRDASGITGVHRPRSS